MLRSHQVSTLLFFLTFACFGNAIVMPQLTLDQKRSIVDYVFALESGIYKESSVILPYTINELNIVTGAKDTPDMHLRNRIDKSFTVFGSAMLDHMLTNPNFTLHTARKRQDALKELYHNPDLLAACRKPMAQIGSAENTLVMGWSHENPFIKESNDMLTSTGNLLGASRSPYAVELIRKGINVFSYSISTALIAGQIALLAPIVRSGRIEIDLRNTGSRVEVGLFMAMALADWAWYTKGVDFFGHHENVSFEIQKMMMDISKATRATKALYSTIKDYPALVKAMSHFEALEAFATNSSSLHPSVRWLMEELESSTFSGEPSSWSMMGRVRACYTSFIQLKHEFIPLFKALGEADALLGVASVMLDHKDKNARYCFTEFVIDSDMPRFEVVDVWNPVLQTNERAAEKLVTESLALGGGRDSVANILLTGPHGSGKSSFMRSAAYAVFLSETLGIAPAKSCHMTFFSTINTYLSVQDNMEKGLSAFMAAQNRLDAIQQRIIALKEDRFGISFIDEPIKDTFEDNAAKLITNFGIAVGPVTEHVCILATHYTEPAVALEGEAAGRFTNYHMEIEERTFGRFKRKFKLAPEKADWWFEKADQRERYINWLKTIA